MVSVLEVGINRYFLGPFFVAFIPIFFVFQGAKVTDPGIIGWGVYYVVLSLFCEYSFLLVFSLTKSGQGSSGGILGCIETRAAYSSALHHSTGANKSWSLQEALTSSHSLSEVY